MKNSKNLILIIAILITTILIGSIVYLRGAEGITTLEIVILFFIISFGIVAIGNPKIQST